MENNETPKFALRVKSNGDLHPESGRRIQVFLAEKGYQTSNPKLTDAFAAVQKRFGKNDAITIDKVAYHLRELCYRFQDDNPFSSGYIPKREQSSRIIFLEEENATRKEEIATLKEEFRAFRAQFGEA